MKSFSTHISPKVCLVGGVLLALSACGSTESETASNTCFYIDSVDSFEAVDNDTLRIQTGPTTWYEADLLGPCLNLRFEQSLAFEGGLGNRICDGAAGGYVITDEDRCAIIALRRIQEPE
ncbi:MAG: DUF6491 family protein [Rhodospirillaceae bacterium]|jgi:hypothetical protein